MKYAELKKGDQTLIPKCWIADSFVSRFMGLMGKKEIPEGEAVCFPKCNSVHTFFMRFSIDVIRLDAHGMVIDVVSGLKPWRMLAPSMKVKHMVEMSSQRSKELGITTGEKLTCNGAWI